MKRIYTLLLIVLMLGTTTLQGCAVVAGAAVGGAAGYMLHEDGYRVRSPVTR